MAISTTSPSATYNMYGVGPRSILKDPNALGMSTTAIWKKVCFDDVHIREYGFILGDNPAVSKGAPLQIDWDYHNEDVIDVDIFEHCREPVRRHRKRIVLSARKRAKILLSAGHTVEEIADMTLQCQTAKKLRVESVKNAGQWELGTLNVNLADFMSGTAEVTGRTLKMVGLDTMGQSLGKAGMQVAKGTGQIVVGTGKLGVGVVLGTGKVATDVVVGTGKVATDVVVGTGKLATDVVVGTGKVGLEAIKGTGKVVVGTGVFLKTGTEDFARGSVRMVTGTLKGIGKAPRRITNIFSQGDILREENLKLQKDHLKTITRGVSEPEPGTASACTSPRSAERRRGKQRRHTEMNKRGLSPLRDSARRTSFTGSDSMLLGPDEDDVIDELTEMELFMKHLQDMDPDTVKRVLADERIQT